MRIHRCDKDRDDYRSLVRRAVKSPEMAGIVSQKNARQRHGSLPVGFERSAKVGDKIAAYSAPRKLLMLRSAAALRSAPSEMSKMHFRNAAAGHVRQCARLPSFFVAVTEIAAEGIWRGRSSWRQKYYFRTHLRSA